MNEETGEIFVSVDADQDHKLLDRETIDTYYVTFEASDGGGLRTTVQLEIFLLDVNDNPPVILRNEYDGYVKENEDQLERYLAVEVCIVDEAYYVAKSSTPTHLFPYIFAQKLSQNSHKGR